MSGGANCKQTAEVDVFQRVKKASRRTLRVDYVHCEAKP